MRGGNSRLGLLAVIAMIFGQGVGMRSPYNLPDADDKVIDPPSSDTTIKFLREKNQAKQQRRNAKRLEQKLKEEQYV